MKDITPRNGKGKPHGYWKRYHRNGRLFYKGNWVNGNRDDYWEWHYSNDQLSCKEFYL